MVKSLDLNFPSLKAVYTQAKTDMLKGDQPADSSFIGVLQNAIDNLDSTFKNSEQAMQGFMSGKNELHDVLITMQKANMEFRMAMQVRTKLVETYQEVMRMQL
jgi:flagellar hook-basal body complex protein FliE